VYLWDTHVVGHFANEHPVLALNVQRVPWEEIVLPSPTVAELLRGRADFAVKATPEQVVLAHQQLQETQRLIAQFDMLVFSDEDADMFRKVLKKFQSKKRYVDLMIAAMALAGNHIVVTRNTKHFSDALPPRQIENWIDYPPQ
jgi:predicted nucleic acid-binding protein